MAAGSGFVHSRMSSVGSALRRAERVLVAGGARQARLNAWTAVCENRRFAAEREPALTPRQD